MKQMVKIGALAGTALVGIAVTIFCIEFVLHSIPSLLPPAVRDNLYIPSKQGVHRFSPVILERDGNLGWKFYPNLDVQVIDPNRTYTLQTIQISQHSESGFRDDGIATPTYAMVLGDSFVDGWSIEGPHNWVELLEAATGDDFVNMGTRGWSSRQHAQMAAQFYPELKPSLVIWTFFINDLLETGTHNQILQEQKTAPFQTFIEQKLQTRSAIWELYRQWTKTGAYRSRPAPLVYPYTEHGLNITLLPDIWDSTVDPTNPLVQDGLATTQDLILQTQQLVQSAGSEFLLLIAPAAEQLYLPLLKDELDPLAFQEKTGKSDFAYLDYPTIALLQFCAAQQLRCLDLTPAFKDAAQQHLQLYLPNDQHWNEAGHQLAADTILTYLQQEKLYPNTLPAN